MSTSGFWEKLRGQLDEVEQEHLIKQELRVAEAESKIEELQARAAQEMAIAQRIASAEYVKIEENYEYHGEGKVGVETNNTQASVGLIGSGAKISRRIIEFRGFKSTAIANIESNGSGSLPLDTEKSN